MALDTAKVFTRSTSDMLTIQRLSEDVTLSSAARMAAIALVVAGWEAATAGSVGRLIGEREGEAREPLLWRINRRNAMERAS